eukprot:5921791-Amphidinium_carterae.2
MKLIIGKSFALLQWVAVALLTVSAAVVKIPAVVHSAHHGSMSTPVVIGLIFLLISTASSGAVMYGSGLAHGKRKVYYEFFCIGAKRVVSDHGFMMLVHCAARRDSRSCLFVSIEYSGTLNMKYDPKVMNPKGQLQLANAIHVDADHRSEHLPMTGIPHDSSTCTFATSMDLEGDAVDVPMGKSTPMRTLDLAGATQPHPSKICRGKFQISTPITSPRHEAIYVDPMNGDVAVFERIVTSVHCNQSGRLAELQS